MTGLGWPGIIARYGGRLTRYWAIPTESGSGLPVNRFSRKESKMQALAFLGIGKVGIVDKPVPDPGPNDAVVKTTASLICTSDVHTVRGVIPIPEGRVLGHESVGVVHKVGT